MAANDSLNLFTGNVTSGSCENQKKKLHVDTGPLYELTKQLHPYAKAINAKLVFWEMELQQNWALTKPRVTMPTFSVILITL